MPTDLIAAIPHGLEVAIAYTVASLAAYSMIQSAKMARREMGCRRYPHLFLWALSFLITGAFCWAILQVLFKLPSGEAFVHGLTAGALYAVTMSFVMGWAKEHKPEVYERLRVPARRKHERVQDQVTSNPAQPPIEPPKEPTERTLRGGDPLDDTYTNLPGF